jgi:SAM-dependent methyltransferase
MSSVMTEMRARVPVVDEDDGESLKRYLLSFEWERRDAAVEEMIVAGGLPLWREILRLLSPASPGARLLELGSLPFHITLLVEKLRGYQITPTAGVVDERPVLRQRLHSRAFAEEREYACACFDLEHERFPYTDESFDVVLFCEVIEHLTENPVFTLSEIHRVLRPGGALILSTPNAARTGNLMRLWFGANVFDQYHLGSALRGTRHSREYTLGELLSLVTGCGFATDVAAGRDLEQIRYTRRTRPLEPLFRLLARFAPGDHHDHLFLRARKNGPFRWSFPREIFDEGHLRWYLDVRADDVVMGENEVPHTSGFWGPLETVAGTAVRAVGAAGGDVHLRARQRRARVEIELAESEAEAMCATASLDAADIGFARGGAGGRLTIVLRAPVEEGAEVRVHLEAASPVRVRRVRLA